MLDTAAVERCLADAWGLVGATVEVHDGGMNSQTWFVTEGTQRWVAKAVATADQPRFASGLVVAERVAAAGIPTGAAMPTRDGRSVVSIDGRTLALLAFVEGDALTGQDEGQQRCIGRTLARAHRAVAELVVPDAEPFHWLVATAPHLHAPSWLRPAIEDALAAYDDLDPGSLTWGLLHSDPAPEAFRLAADGTCGLIDWDRALHGPLLYDLASAVMYVGGPDRAGPLVDAYLDGGTLDRAEVERGLVPMLGLRWAVQSDYFSRRIARDDLTGIDDRAGNEKGLADARRGLDATRRRRTGASGV